MKIKGMAVLAAAFAASTAIVAPASAATITYTYTSTFTGTNNGNPFVIGATFTGVGDTTANTTIGGFPAITLTSLTAAADGPYQILDAFVFAVNSTSGIAGFIRQGAFANGFSFLSPSLIGYDGKSNVSATTLPFYTISSVATDRGNIVLTGQTAGTFSAVVSNVAAVPEPATWAMMLLGFGMVGFGMRYGVRRSNAKFDLKVKRIAAGLDA